MGCKLSADEAVVALSNLRDGYARSIPEHRRRVVWDRWYIEIVPSNRLDFACKAYFVRSAEVMHSDGIRIGIDGYNLGLPQGTESTYGINLIKLIGSAGFHPEILHEARLRGRTRALREVSLFDAYEGSGGVLDWCTRKPGLVVRSALGSKSSRIQLTDAVHLDPSRSYWKIFSAIGRVMYTGLHFDSSGTSIAPARTGRSHRTLAHHAGADCCSWSSADYRPRLDSHSSAFSDA